eukprot:7039639-Pyramimonas_sp.AAC.1
MSLLRRPPAGVSLYHNSTPFSKLFGEKTNKQTSAHFPEGWDDIGRSGLSWGAFCGSVVGLSGRLGRLFGRLWAPLG